VKETTTFGVPYNPEVEITKRIDRHAGGDKKFSLLVCEDTEYHTLQSGSGVFKKNQAVVNIYQLCIGVHVLNDLMALVLAVPNGERFIRSIGV
jgi:hypothetical protein